jgi:hypothetical protein
MYSRISTKEEHVNPAGTQAQVIQKGSPMQGQRTGMNVTCVVFNLRDQQLFAHTQEHSSGSHHGNLKAPFVAYVPKHYFAKPNQ